ncbi:WcbI family polysaccharide biosynthesis putative acetyltransferase [Roseicella aquatilis]|uniref:Polysaccharide biosynthesis enzyme WcbI domain-containing protein n=1 Tax=Roseicella aquatilis TaxID=2527868 RepID=A0A4R4DU21_9PROT|nr:WcbI family polysaccharide biosynthesis putative acetyltransferase [Roseicella aquatilis]TCZ65355.1 hypothetical protein EXY23_04055 [Roseicella aquatilis]
MRIAVLGVCQAHGYAHGLAHLLPEAEVEAFEAVVSRNHGQVEQAAELLRGFDVIFTQEFGDEFGPLGTGALPRLGRPVHRLPVVAFPGYHPDMIYLTLHGQVQGSPVGAYHSAIVAAAFALGVEEADVPQLFNRLVYARLGYLEGFGRARTLLLELLARYGLDMAADVESWHADGPFMHGINHPRGPVLADVARAAAIRAGLLRPDAPRVRPPFDHLAADTIWPVYPEIAEVLGVPGSMLFKRYSHPVGPLGNALYIGLPRLVRESYGMYRALPPDAFREGAVAKVREALAGMLG